MRGHRGRLEFLGSYLEPSGDILSHLGGQLGISEAFLEPSWATLDAPMDRRPSRPNPGGGVSGRGKTSPKGKKGRLEGVSTPRKRRIGLQAIATRTITANILLYRLSRIFRSRTLLGALGGCQALLELLGTSWTLQWVAAPIVQTQGPVRRQKKGGWTRKRSNHLRPEGCCVFCSVFVYFAFFGPRRVPRRHDRIRFETLVGMLWSRGPGAWRQIKLSPSPSFLFLLPPSFPSFCSLFLFFPSPPLSFFPGPPTVALARLALARQR